MTDATPSEQRERLPVTVLTGFLGAGKTTLLRNILKDAGEVRYGILVNDFGALNVDADLVVEQTADRVALSNGCVCCSIRDDMATAVHTLLRSEAGLDHIIIEASGVARPLAVIDGLMADDLGDEVALNAVLCLLDADAFLGLDYADTELALDQVSAADIVILNKVDLASEHTLSTLSETVEGAVPRARVVRAVHAKVSKDVLFGPQHLSRTASQQEATPGNDHADGSADADGYQHRHADAHAEGHADRRADAHTHADTNAEIHDHADAFQAWHWRSADPVDERRFRRALRSLPKGLLRAKGIVRTAAGEGRLVFHLVGKRLHVTHEPGSAPAETTIVAIGRHGTFDPATLDALFEDAKASGE